MRPLPSFIRPPTQSRHYNIIYIYLYVLPLTFSQCNSQQLLCYFCKTNQNLKTFTERQAEKDCIENIAKRLGGGHTNGQKEFKQCCAQCDYLPFFHAGCSFRGHYHLILSISHRQHTQKQVGLCHFNDSIASGVLHRLCSVTLQRPMWRCARPTSLN